MNDELLKRVGLCLKDSDGRVLSQNAICLKICGNYIGQICDKACMREGAIPPGEIRHEVFIAPQSPRDAPPIDSILWNDGEHLLTFLLDRLPALDHLRAQLSPHIARLTATESNILESLLNGSSNRQLAGTLHISPATLKTHLNNMYRKLPAATARALRRWRQSRHNPN